MVRAYRRDPWRRRPRPATARPWGTAVADDVWIDDGGLLRRGGEWVALPDIDWRMAELLLGHVDEVVRREDLATAAWPGRVSDDGALNVRVKLLRQRVTPLGLVLTTVRGRATCSPSVTGQRPDLEQLGQPGAESSSGTVSPGAPVTGSATKNGWAR